MEGVWINEHEDIIFDIDEGVDAVLFLTDEKYKELGERAGIEFEQKIIPRLNAKYHQVKGGDDAWINAYLNVKHDPVSDRTSVVVSFIVDSDTSSKLYEIPLSKNEESEFIAMLDKVLAKQGIFEYQGYHFEPVGKFSPETSFRGNDDEWLVGNNELCLKNYDGLGRYSYNDFCNATSHKNVDVFMCMETGDVYTPGEHELFEYKGFYEPFLEHMDLHNKLTLTYVGEANFGYPAYKDDYGRLWANTNDRYSDADGLCSLTGNSLEGEPNEPFHKEKYDKVVFVGEPDLREKSYELEYMMLGRMKSDCEYFLGYGMASEKYLKGGNVSEHIAEMKKLWDKLPADLKPEWLTMQQIEDYGKRMTGALEAKKSRKAKERSDER